MSYVSRDFFHFALNASFHVGVWQETVLPQYCKYLCIVNTQVIVIIQELHTQAAIGKGTHTATSYH